MIPKTLHVVWLSGDPLPDLVQKCLKSWREVMPDFEIRFWGLEDLQKLRVCDFAREAIAHRRWAFATDALRLEILRLEGGICLDSDVIAVRSLTPLLGYRCFTAVECHPLIFERGGGKLLLDEEGRRLSRQGISRVPGLGIQAAVMGAVAGHPFIEACCQHYLDSQFVLEQGRFNEDPIAPSIYGTVAEKFGFRWLNDFQLLSEGVAVLPCSVIASHPDQYGRDTLLAHCCAGSWR
jgi:hypothetical protein